MPNKRKPVVLLEFDFYTDPKISRLRRMYDTEQGGLAAIAVYTIILCELRINRFIRSSDVRDLSYEKRLDYEFVQKCLDNFIHSDIKLLQLRRGIYCSDALNDRLKLYDELCEKRRVAGGLGGTQKKNNSELIQTDASTCLASGKQLPSKDIYIYDLLNKDPNKKEGKPKPVKQGVIKQELKKYGAKFLQMSPENMKKLVDKFTRQAVIKNLPDADHWIASDLSSNASKYRHPNQDHYLFFSGWLKRNAAQETASMTGIMSRNQPSRPQPPAYTPPKVEDPASPEAVAEFRKRVSEIAKKKGVRPLADADCSPKQAIVE